MSSVEPPVLSPGVMKILLGRCKPKEIGASGETGLTLWAFFFPFCVEGKPMNCEKSLCVLHPCGSFSLSPLEL